MPQTVTLAFVNNSEMAEILANKRLVKRLRKGSQDAKRKKGKLKGSSIGASRSRSYR